MSFNYCSGCGCCEGSEQHYTQAEVSKLYARIATLELAVKDLAYALNEIAHYSDHVEPLNKHAEIITAAGKKVSSDLF